MRHYYSLAVFSKISIQYKEPFVLIEPGMNAFTILVENAESFFDQLKLDGIRIDKVARLDGTDEDHTGTDEALPPSFPSAGPK
jgi:hypothetical protein